MDKEMQQHVADVSTNFKRGSAYASGNQAIADAEFYRKLLGIKVEIKFCHIVLTCDANGNLS